ncbi:MAG: hypothetical protein HQL74_13890 [Magnetococcales bacterium]|nr:hypothetical protein [Magnetococcales bacterium]
MSLMFDSLAYAKKLKAAGMPEAQAEIQAETIMEWMDDKLATKVELDVVRADLKRDIKELDVKAETRFREMDIKAETRFREMDAKVEVTKAEIKRDLKELEVKLETIIKTSNLELRKEIESAKVDTIKWTAGMFVAQTALIVGAVFAVMKMNHPNPQPAGYHTPPFQEMRLPAPSVTVSPAPASSTAAPAPTNAPPSR